MPKQFKLLKKWNHRKHHKWLKYNLRRITFSVMGKSHGTTIISSSSKPRHGNFRKEGHWKQLLINLQCGCAYVDDVWAVWTHGKETLTEFLQHLHSIHPKH